MNKDYQYYLITVTDGEFMITQYDYGIDYKFKYKNTESYIGNSGVSVTIYSRDEFEDFKQAYTNLNRDKLAQVKALSLTK